MSRYSDLQKKIESLPKGYLSKKTINGKERFYLQYRDGSSIKSTYVKAEEVENVRSQIEERKKLEIELKELLENANPLRELSSSAASLDGSIMSFDEEVARFEKGRLVWIDPKRAPHRILRTKDLSDWLSHRAIDSHRVNSRILKKVLRIHETDDAMVAARVYGVTITDHFWFRPKHSKLKYEDVHFQNDFYCEVSLSGSTYRLPKKEFLSPELSSIGSYEKCWRLLNGRWWMEKRGTKLELFSEWFSSRLAEAIGLPSAHYELTEDTIRTLHFAPELDFEPMSSWCGDDDSYEAVFPVVLSLGESFAKEYLKLCWFDCLIHNVDRHNENYGILRDPKTGEILSLAPNFDDNLSLFARGIPETPSRKDDGLIRMFLSFLKKTPSAIALYHQLALPEVERETIHFILLGQDSPVDEDFLFEYLTSGTKFLSVRENDKEQFS